MDFDSEPAMTTTTTNALKFAKRDVPRIGGSFGGFVALVVCLIFIIIAACTAIYFVLRHDKELSSRTSSSRHLDPERAAANANTKRRHKYHHHHHTPVASSSSPYVYGESTSTPSRTWLAALGGMFSSASASIKGGRHSRGHTSSSDPGKRGWMQAASGDEWDDEDDVYHHHHHHPVHHHDDNQQGGGGSTFRGGNSSKPSRIVITNPSPAMSTIYSQSSSFSSPSPGLDSPFKPPVYLESSSATAYSAVPQTSQQQQSPPAAAAVSVVTGGSPVSHHPTTHSSYFASRSEPAPGVSPLSSSPSSPMSPSILSGVAFRAASPEPMSGLATSNSPTAAGGTNSQVGIPKGQQQQQHPDPNRQLSGQTVKSVQSVQSGQTHVSTRTFSGGTKFIEDI